MAPGLVLYRDERETMYLAGQNAKLDFCGVTLEIERPNGERCKLRVPKALRYLAPAIIREASSRHGVVRIGPIEVEPDPSDTSNGAFRVAGSDPHHGYQVLF
jgi:hypothetical protein